MAGRARAYLARQSPYHDWDRCPPPSLVVLDLGLPDMNGIEILEWMAEWEWLAKIPVIVFTASEDPEHERSAYAWAYAATCVSPRITAPWWRRSGRSYARGPRLSTVRLAPSTSDPGQREQS